MRNVHPIVRQIIDRDCHVAMSSRAVIRHVVSRLRDGYPTLRAMNKTDRRRLMADCIAVHAQNRALYAAVMGGTPRPKRRKRRGKEYLPDSTLSGRELVRLMRASRCTIAELARRLGLSQKRVRLARERGLPDGLAVRDWIEAITGRDPGPIPKRLVTIRDPSVAHDCAQCKRSLRVGEVAFEYGGEMFCSVRCCRASRGWQ